MTETEFQGSQASKNPNKIRWPVSRTTFGAHLMWDHPRAALLVWPRTQDTCRRVVLTMTQGLLSWKLTTKSTTITSLATYLYLTLQHLFPLPSTFEWFSQLAISSVVTPNSQSVTKVCNTMQTNTSICWSSFSRLTKNSKGILCQIITARWQWIRLCASGATGPSWPRSWVFAKTQTPSNRISTTSELVEKRTLYTPSNSTVCSRATVKTLCTP